MRTTRIAAALAGATMIASLAGCATNTPMYGSSYSTAPVYSTTTAALEFGRVTNIEYLPAGTAAPMDSNRSIIGAVVGGLAGAALGSTIGAGAGRTAATVLGAVGGAAVGNHIARNQQGITTAPGYRVTVQTEQGGMRTYEVSATGDLHVGDRVRVENNVIYRA